MVPAKKKPTQILRGFFDALFFRSGACLFFFDFVHAEPLRSHGAFFIAEAVAVASVRYHPNQLPVFRNLEPCQRTAVVLSVDEDGDADAVFHFLCHELFDNNSEPRLVTKFDFSDARPDILKKNSLSILPVSNGSYAVSRFILYEPVMKPVKGLAPSVKSVPSWVKSVDIQAISSEQAALHAAEVTGIIDDFLGGKYIQTINGRMRPDSFSFIADDINGMQIDIHTNSPQIEIDAGYESSADIALFEAKASRHDDFIIRQLYYPYRYWTQAVPDKEIRTVFMIYENGTFYLYEYVFDNRYQYNSIRLIRHRTYVLV